MQRDEILRIAEAHGASNVRVIGSVARGDAIPESDIDLLVDFDRAVSGFEFFGRWEDLRRALEGLLGRPVDVIESGGLKYSRERVRSRILGEAVPL